MSLSWFAGGRLRGSSFACVSRELSTRAADTESVQVRRELRLSGFDGDCWRWFQRVRGGDFWRLGLFCQPCQPDCA